SSHNCYGRAEPVSPASGRRNLAGRVAIAAGQNTAVAAAVRAASASSIRHADRSRGPTRLDTVRSSPKAAPAAAAAHATPYPSIASATAIGWADASAAARSAVPVTVATVSTSPVIAFGSATWSVASTTGSAATVPDPRPSRSSGRKPSGESAPRSAWRLRLASTVAPTGARPGNPPATPAEITVRYGRPDASASASTQAAPAAAAAGPTPAAVTVTPVCPGGSPASTASRSAATAVTTSTGGIIPPPGAGRAESPRSLRLGVTRPWSHG